MKKKIKNIDAYMKAVNRRQEWTAETKEAHKKNNQLGIFWDSEEINTNQKLIEEKEEKGIDDKEHKKIVDYFKKELTKIK